VFRLDELLWERWMVAAGQAWAAGDRRAAGLLWRAAAAEARGFAEGDPRRAASFDALATLAGAEARDEAGRLLLRNALAAWDGAAAWVEAMSPGHGARSSAFHLRLEAKHPGAYPEIVRQRHRRTLAAGRAGTAANLAALEHDEAGLARALDARRAAFGPRESGAAAVAARLGLAVEGRVIDRFAERPPEGFDDERRLHAAALLAPVLASGAQG
jgi:hypothetical protein